MMTPDEFSKELTTHLGDNLVSIILYGSSAMEDTTKLFSDINILIVVKNSNIDTLRGLSPIVKSWCRQGNPPPSILTRDSLEKGKDVFAIEFSDIQAAHKVLHGENLFSHFKFDASSLRHQLEFELRSKLLLLRKNYMESSDDKKALQQLMARSFSSFSVLAKTILRLLNQPVPNQKKAAWVDLGKALHLDTEAIDLILQLREGEKLALKMDPDIIFEKYLVLIEKIIEFVDNFGKK